MRRAAALLLSPSVDTFGEPVFVVSRRREAQRARLDASSTTRRGHCRWVLILGGEPEPPPDARHHAVRDGRMNSPAWQRPEGGPVCYHRGQPPCTFDLILTLGPFVADMVAPSLADALNHQPKLGRRLRQDPADARPPGRRRARSSERSAEAPPSLAEQGRIRARIAGGRR